MTKLTKEALEARRLYYKEWRLKNKEKLKKKRKSDYKRDKEKHKKWSQDYWERKGKKLKDDDPNLGGENE